MFSVVLVEVKGIEPSDSDLARITRNPITTPKLDRIVLSAKTSIC